MTKVDPLAQNAFKEYMRSRQLEKAQGLCDQILKKDAGNPQGWFQLSEILIQTGKPTEALKFALRSVQLAPDLCPAMTQLAKCYLLLGNHSTALQYATQATKLETDDLDDLDTLANIFSRCNQEPTALKLFSKAADLNPNNADLLYNLATSQRFLGHTTAADQSFSRAIELNPLDHQAVLGRTQLRRQSVEDNHIDTLEANLKSIGMGPEGKIHYHYSLAKEYEDIERFNDSFTHLKRGADLKNATLNFELGDELTNMDQLTAMFNRESLASVKTGCQSDQPLFVLGLPRTGTTLVERILASHPQVSSGGELNTFPSQLISLLAQKDRKSQTGKDTISQHEADRLGSTPSLANGNSYRHSLNIDFLELGNNYLKSALSRVEQKPYFVDKLPFNYLNIGYIKLALPQAKVILLERDPMDACYAIYKNLFADKHYPWSYKLENIARYHLRYLKLMDHWQTVLLHPPYVIKYENLVSEPETQVRALLEYCSLPWDAACLRFYENESASTTSSASQVRTPIYTRSIGMWKNYQDQLKDISLLFG